VDGLLSKYESENCNPTVLPLKPSDVDMIERIPIPVTPAPKHVRAFWLEARSGGGSKDAIRHVGPVMVVFYTISAVILIL
jgi:hypothetical protein